MQDLSLLPRRSYHSTWRVSVRFEFFRSYNDNIFRNAHTGQQSMDLDRSPSFRTLWLHHDKQIDIAMLAGRPASV